jgi:hypothetical protein
MWEHVTTIHDSSLMDNLQVPMTGTMWAYRKKNHFSKFRGKTVL